MPKLLAIALGGAAGALARYAVGEIATRTAGDHFPLGTLLVNALGCLAMGFLAAAMVAGALREELRLGVLVGFLGALTTFSTLGWETVGLLNDGQWGRAAANVLLNNLLGLSGALLGYRLAERFVGA